MASEDKNILYLSLLHGIQVLERPNRLDFKMCSAGEGYFSVEKHWTILAALKKNKFDQFGLKDG